MLVQSNGKTPGVHGATGLCSLVKLVYTLPTKAVRDLLEEAIKIRTAGQHKCRLLHFVLHGLVNILERSNGRTPGVQGATGPPSLVQLLYTHATGTVKDRFVVGVHRRTAGVRKCRSLQIVRHDIVNMLDWCNGRIPGIQGVTGPPSLIQLLYTESTGTVRDRFEGIVQICTAGLRKSHSLQIYRQNLVNMLEWSNGRTPGVQGATALRSLIQLVYTQPNATVRRPTLENCTDPYSRYTKMPFIADCSLQLSEHA